eukprot:scaffold22930_cov92-Amphora_coffeaeformis.AAC.1
MPGTKLEDLLAGQQAQYHTWSSSDFTIPLCTTLISDPVDIPLCKILEGNEPPKGVLIGAPLYLPPHINTNTEDSWGNSLIALFHNKAITCGFFLKSCSHPWNFVHVSCTRDRLYNGGKKSSTNSGKKMFHTPQQNQTMAVSIQFPGQIQSFSSALGYDMRENK